jgi:hypothetical protein
LNYASKHKIRRFIKTIRPQIGEGTTEQQLEVLTSLLPPELGANVAKLWSTDAKLKRFLVSRSSPLAIAPPTVVEQKQQLAIEGPFALGAPPAQQQLPMEGTQSKGQMRPV